MHRTWGSRGFYEYHRNIFLDQILAESENPLPSHIVTELDKRIVKSLRQYGRRDGVADGMDVALCRIDKKNSKVLFCGAHRPLYFVSNNVLTEYKSIRLSVGGFSGNLKKEFEDEIISYQKGDAFYIFRMGMVISLEEKETDVFLQRK